jgi:hypothetical protein
MTAGGRRGGIGPRPPRWPIKQPSTDQLDIRSSSLLQPPQQQHQPHQPLLQPPQQLNNSSSHLNSSSSHLNSSSSHLNNTPSHLNNTSSHLNSSSSHLNSHLNKSTMANVVETLQIEGAGLTINLPLWEFLDAYWNARVTVLDNEDMDMDDSIRGALHRVFDRAVTPGSTGDAILFRYDLIIDGHNVAQATHPTFGPVVGINLDDALIKELGIDDLFTVEDRDNIIFLKDDGRNIYISRNSLLQFLYNFAG